MGHELIHQFCAATFILSKEETRIFPEYLLFVVLKCIQVPDD